MTIKKGLFGPHLREIYNHVCTGECIPAGGIHVVCYPTKGSGPWK